MVSFSLHQVTSLVDRVGNTPLYRVTNQVTDAVGANTAVFVYKTATQTFAHYANAADMERWPATYEEALAGNLAYYRVNSVARSWETLAEMYEDLDMTLRRIRSLAGELAEQQGSVTINRTTVIEVE